MGKKDGVAIEIRVYGVAVHLKDIYRHPVVRGHVMNVTFSISLNYKEINDIF